MDWKKLIADLTAAEMTQVQIAKECGVAQSAISDLGRGKTKSPNYALGDKLRELHRERCAATAQAEPTQAATAGA
jgi:predicted transcriptional regulator